MRRQLVLDYEPWKGATEIQMWVEATGISERTYIVDVYDCDDMAVDLFFIALAEKRPVYLLQQDIRGRNGKWRRHILNFTWHGNQMYSIDPVSNKVSKLCPIDNYPPSWKIIPSK